MTNRNMTVQQSADRLGFSDASTFRRAFRRWYDTTPTGYRRG
jgi:AraC-like DNA-binding protein